jgi:ABC-type cobalamin/Fe3+-siderophores transport system ATPase subunit
MSALLVERLVVTRSARVVLNEVSCAVHPGRVLGLIGPNGSGKSSLVMAASGVLPVSSGRVTIAGEDLLRWSPAARAQTVAYVPQRTELVSALRVDEVVAMGRFTHPDGGAFGRRSAHATAAIAQALHLVDAQALCARIFTELSGGEMQRVLIARALATGARYLLLDEPTSALDVGHRLAILSLIRRLAQEGKGVLVALHDLHEAAQVADQVTLLQDGRCLRQGTVAEVISAGPVLEAYGVELIPGGGFGYRLQAPPPAG